MNDHIYRIIEVVGSSEQSSDDAIRAAMERASNTVDDIGWFQVVETRGHVEKGRVKHFQVTLKIGFTLHEAVENGE